MGAEPPALTVPTNCFCTCVSALEMRLSGLFKLAREGTNFPTEYLAFWPLKTGRI
jgi:hypothetical protein